MSEPMAGVHVCLVGKNGSAVLQRIPPVNDPLDRQNMMRDICNNVRQSLWSMAAFIMVHHAGDLKGAGSAGFPQLLCFLTVPPMAEITGQVKQ